jgi:glycosyltransferase involved in cell wall biosynthesis
LGRHRNKIVNRVVESLRWRLGVGDLTAKISSIERRIEKLESVASTWAVMSWIEQAPPTNEPLVSIILPTHNRSRRLERAVASLTGQAYSNWELVIIDDGSSDETPVVIERLRHDLGENRLRAIRIDRSGVCAARNAGLRAARGELIAYLDDDNLMHSLWLKAVVWAFAQFPEVEVVYGGIIVDDILRVNRKARGALPAYYLHPFERQRLINSNLADIGVIAHRAGLPEAHFDESLREMGDWDLLVRLTRQKAPLVLPVLGCFYFTDEPERLSGGPTFQADAARVREKAHL